MLPANLVTTQAEAKALGLIANNGNLDGYVGFDAAANTFSYSTTAGPPSSEYDFVSVVEHEFSEIMGRISGLDISTAYTPMDLYRYSAANTPQFTAGAASYFSIDNGVTDLDNWNNFQTGNTGDLGDWAPSAGNDAFDDNGNPGVVNAVTATDLTLMNAIGWTSAPPLQIMLSSDVFWLNGDGTLAAWTVAGPQEVTYQGNPAVPDPALWSVAGIGDFNGNGTSDVLWRNTNGLLAEWTMSGSQITADQYVTYQGNLAGPGASWSVAGIGDFSGDGKSDILWRNINGTLVDWTMNGSQIAADQYVTYQGNLAGPDSSWSIAEIGDFNGDGKSDILWRNVNGTLVDWTMNGSQVTADQTVTFQGSPAMPDASWQIAQIGDFNGNGKSDILWRNSDGALAEWTMNGSQVTAIQQGTFQGNPAAPTNSWSTLAKPTDFV